MAGLSRSVAFLAGFLSLAGTAAAQQLHKVWVVTTQSQLNSAVNSAADGDTVLVKASGTYYLLVQAKSLTVIADPPADVFVQLAEVKDLTASQQVELRGLKLFTVSDCFDTFQSYPGLKLLNNEGRVWIEDCTVLPHTNTFCWTVPGIVVDGCDDVVLLRTSSTGTGVGGDVHSSSGVNVGHGLVLRGDSRVVAHGCTFQGADGHGPDVGSLGSADGAAGILSESAGDRIFLSDCHATGGDGAYSDEEGFIDCSIGGPGISSTGVTWLFDSQATGGSGATGLGCSSPAGPAFTGNVQSLPGQALRFSITAPVREGQSYQLDFLGPPNTPAWFLFSPDPSERFRLRGPLVGDASTVSFAGLTDATGALQVTRSMPNMPPNLELGRLYAQAFYLGPRGEIVLGGASLFLALDQSF